MLCNFFLCHKVCAARGVLACSFSGTIAFPLSLRCACPVPFRSPHGPPGGKINSVNLEHLVPQPQGLRCYWLHVPLLAGDPYEMGC